MPELLFTQAGNAFACRTFNARNTQMGWGSNRPLLAGVGISLIILAALIYFAPLRQVFDNIVPPKSMWPFLFLYALILYGLEWLRKRLFQRMDRKRTGSLK